MAVPASFGNEGPGLLKPSSLSLPLSVCGTPVSPPYGCNAPGIFLWDPVSLAQGWEDGCYHYYRLLPPSPTRTSSSSTRAQRPTRRRTVTIAVIIARSGVAGASQLIREMNKKNGTRGRGTRHSGYSERAQTT
ncbi:hypothetical protein TcCL_Unassigned01669 [Trypanosoma cruzi]|nr:hypothetical protein TcCL_Unassigned01669 [Trypanosoma cruzi]